MKRTACRETSRTLGGELRRRREASGGAERWSSAGAALEHSVRALGREWPVPLRWGHGVGAITIASHMDLQGPSQRFSALFSALSPPALSPLGPPPSPRPLLTAPPLVALADPPACPAPASSLRLLHKATREAIETSKNSCRALIGQPAQATRIFNSKKKRKRRTDGGAEISTSRECRDPPRALLWDSAAQQAALPKRRK